MTALPGVFFLPGALQRVPGTPQTAPAKTQGALLGEEAAREQLVSSCTRQVLAAAAAMVRAPRPSQRSVLERTSWGHRHVCCPAVIPAQLGAAAANDTQEKDRSLWMGLHRILILPPQHTPGTKADQKGLREQGLYRESRGRGRATGPMI